MYTHPGLLLAFSQGFSQDLLSSHYPFFSLPHDQLLPINNPNLGSIVQSSAVLEYDLGGEGDLFKAPEPIIGESVLALDPIASGMPLISDVDDVITAETIQIADVESIQIEHLDDIINECKKVFLGKSLTEETIPEHEVAQQIDEEDSEKAKSRIIAEGQTQKSVSSGSLKSMEWINACCNRRPNFLNYQGLDFEAAFGMRRPISEEALQGSIVQSSAVLEYDLGGEGDLFKAPEPIIGESVLALDPIASGMSLISDVDDVITAETIQIADVESIQIEHLDDIINECKKVFLAKSLTEETIPEHEVAQQIDEEDSEKAKSRIIAEGQMQKSVSSGSLESMEWINACCNRRPNFLNYQGLDFEAALGMRRPIREEALQGSIVQSSAIFEYDLGGEGDLFKSPKPIIGESVLALDPIASGMSLISDVDDVITTETIQIADVESIQIEHLDDIINECKKVFLAKSLTEETIPEHEVAHQIDEEDSEKAKSRIIAEGQMQKSVSSGSLESMEWINACCNRRPNFLNYQGLDFEAALGMRRPISEEALQGSIVQSSAVLEYDLGGEGDLFKAPEPIIGESVLALDPIASGMSLISDVDDVITAETIQIADVESIQIEHLDDIINECKKVFLAKSLTEETIPEHEVAQQIDEEDSEKAKSRIIAEGQMQKSVSSGSLESMEWINACCNRRPNFLNYQGLDFEAALGMRRPIREEALQTPVSDNYTSDNCTGILHAYKKSEERREKLSRYRRKKSLRNFNRKIVYAGRKAFADNQLRVRGRFAKTGDRCIYPDHRKKSLKR